ncbi:MAG: putative glutathione S-transferase [Myxococcota bacterium]|jgi:putative glutathione S-transferase
MGLLVEGKWVDQWYDTSKSGGTFVRKDASFRSWVTADGSSGFPAEAGRYRLYVSLACPWAHRTLVFLALKGLEDSIAVTVVDPMMLDKGWPLVDGGYLYEVYQAAKSDYTGRVTVPVLWDETTGTIVSNESSEIIRMLNSEFDALATRTTPDYWPKAERDAIEEVNQRIYSSLNNGVYKCGFATKQDAYEAAYEALFDTMEWLEERLGGSRYLMGDHVTEADWRLFTTLVRFDPVYYSHFKCNRRRLMDYPNLWGYTRELYQVPGVAGTVNMDHIKRHYFGCHETVNPTRIVPVGPDIDYTTPHGRGQGSTRLRPPRALVRFPD